MECIDGASSGQVAKFLAQRQVVIIGKDWNAHLMNNIARIDLFLHDLGGDTGIFFLIEECGLDGGCASVFGEEGSMEVNGSEGWGIDEVHGQYFSIGDDDNEVDV